MTDIPLPAPGDTSWSDWGQDEEDMSDLVHAATSAATASTLVKRDAAGRAQFVDGSAAADAATKGQLDTAIAGRVPTSRQVASGTGLSGGGDLSADRTLAVSYGSTAGTSVQGNDARVTADQVAGTASIRTLGTGAQQAAAGNHAHTAAAVGAIPAFADPNADQMVFWDDSAGAFAGLAPTALLPITGTSIDVRATSETQTGVVELATAAETTTGTDNTRAVHPAGLKVELDKKAARGLSKNTITGNYTLVAADAIDTVLHTTAATGLTITLPSDANASIAQEIAIPWRQYGAGQITFAAGAGATLESRGSVFKSAGQRAEGLLTKVGANAWLLSGDITA